MHVGGAREHRERRRTGGGRRSRFVEVDRASTAAKNKMAKLMQDTNDLLGETSDEYIVEVEEAIEEWGHDAQALFNVSSHSAPTPPRQEKKTSSISCFSHGSGWSPP